jgi:hypothetical protein
MHSDQLPDFDVAGHYRWTVIEAHESLCAVRINAEKTARTFEDFDYEFMDEVDKPAFVLAQGKRLMLGVGSVMMDGELVDGPTVIYAKTRDVVLAPVAGRFLGMTVWV